MSDEGRVDLQIRGVPKKIKNELSEIAEEMGVTLSAYLKPKLREMIQQHNNTQSSQKRSITPFQ